MNQQKILVEKENNSFVNRIVFKKTAVAAIFFWLLVWQIGAMLLQQDLLLVSPIAVFQKLSVLVIELSFWKTIFFSFCRIAIGFFSAMFCGVVLAIISSQFRLIKVLLEPFFFIIKTVPVASFIILCLIWLSSSNLSIFISFMMVLPIIYTNVMNGIASTDPKLLEMADVFNIHGARRIVYIYISHLMPFFISACSLSLGLSWKSGVAAEVIGIPSDSIGERLYLAKVYLNTPELFAWTIVIIAISVLFEKIFFWLIYSGFRRLEKI